MTRAEPPEYVPRPKVVLRDLTQPADHLLIMGLLDELPLLGADFPEERRVAWLEAVAAALSVLYPKEPPA